MNRKLEIDILDNFHDALIYIQHALNDPNAPNITMAEFKKRVTLANDSYVAMIVSEIWESVDSTLKCVNQCLDLIEFIDNNMYDQAVHEKWFAYYCNAKKDIDLIYHLLYEESCRQNALI